MKIASNLERCGDLAKNIAKRALVIAESRADHPAHPLDRAHGPAGAGRLKDVLDAYAARDVERARGGLAPATSEVDEHYNSLFRELLTYMMGDPRTITACAHLLFVAKNLERIGDHATNIAEIVHYEITGEEIDRPSGPRARSTACERRGRAVKPYILVVEDEDALATLLQYNLEKEGYARRAAPATARRRCCRSTRSSPT